MEMINGIPRRNRIDLNFPAELAIYNAMGEVEKMGASLNLTKAITLLQEAKNALADHIENLPLSEEKKEEPKEQEVSVETEIDKFYHILLKQGIEDRAFFTSNEFHTIWNAVKEFAEQYHRDSIREELRDELKNSALNKHNVIGSVCDHPNRQREYYRDGAYKCWKCHKVIVIS